MSAQQLVGVLPTGDGAVADLRGDMSYSTVWHLGNCKALVGASGILHVNLPIVCRHGCEYSCICRVAKDASVLPTKAKPNLGNKTQSINVSI